jgi:hypothetical protein
MSSTVKPRPAWLRVADQTGFGDAARWLSPAPWAGWAWSAFSAVSFLSVVAGIGGMPNLVAGVLTGLVGFTALHQRAEDNYRADLESYEADTRDADVEWWLDTLRYSDIEQERIAARFMIDYWGVRSHLNPLISEADREAQAKRIQAKHASAQRKAALLAAEAREKDRLHGYGYTFTR